MGLNFGRMIFCLSKSNHLHYAIMFIVLFSACNNSTSPTSPDYGATYNHVRDSLGLKPLSPDWEISKQSKDLNEELWIYYNNPYIDSTQIGPKAYYAGKTLKIRNDSLVNEIDTYIVVRIPEPTKKIIEKRLTYNYYYNPRNRMPRMFHEYSINPQPVGSFFIEYEDGRTRRDSLGELLPMTRAEADSILATWGMKYP